MRNLSDFFAYFINIKLSFYLVGGFAVNFHGYHRATGDLHDIAELNKIQTLKSKKKDS